MQDHVDFPPLHVVGATGCRLHLADGREVLDAISSWWCKSLGHGHPRLVAAAQAQAAAFEHVILANVVHDPALTLAKRLLALANAPLSAARHYHHVFFADNGSSGVEVALKMAVHWQAQAGDPRRTRLACLAGGYHGETVGALAVGDLGLYAEPYRSLLFPCSRLDAVPWRDGPEDPAWLDAAAEWPVLERQLAPLADTLAAIVYEPLLQGAGGMHPVSPDLLVRLRHWADAHGVLLIADEIASGMYRCGTFLAGHQAPGDGAADLVVLSKGLTGGWMPLATVLAPARIHDAFLAAWHERKAFLHSNTYAGNPLACAVANAALDTYAAEDIPARVATSGPWLRARLRDLAARQPCLRHVRGVGQVAAVDLTRPDGSPRDPLERGGWRVFQAAVARGALLRPLGDTLYLFPPLNASPAELEAMLTILAQSVTDVTRL
jgi:adenosylmethionine-8-amino-7-oxononanoate aminotransferase